MIKINLAPRENVKKIYRTVLISKILFSVFIVFIIVSVISVMQYTKVKSLEYDYADKQRKYELLKEDVKKAEEIQKRINEINNYISAIDKITKNRYIYVAFLQDIVNNLPDTMWFNGINTSLKGDKIEVSLMVNSNSLEDFLWWYSFLDNNKRFTDLKMTTISSSGSGIKTKYSIPVSFKYSYE